jgi:hypothetical protein
MQQNPYRFLKLSEMIAQQPGKRVPGTDKIQR